MSAKKAKHAKKTAKIPAPKLNGDKTLLALKQKLQPSGKRPHAGLGRGLDSLMASPAAIAAKPVVPLASTTQPAPLPPADNSLREIPIAEIATSPYQPRQVFEPAALEELAASIRTSGIIQPIVVRPLAPGKYELISGERRLRATQLAGKAKVPAVIRKVGDHEAAEMTIIENIQREDLNPIDEADGYLTLKEKFGLTQEELADRVGKSREAVANALRLVNLTDEVKQLVSSRLLSAGHARTLLALTKADDQNLLARRCVEEHLSVRTLERLVAERKSGGVKAKAPARINDLPESYLRDLSDRLHKHFGTGVVLVSSGKSADGKKKMKGTLTVDFYDNEDLERILSLLGISPNAD